jgi:hypothetical protein
VDTAGLYHGPLEDFVARRTALVRELRSADPDAASAAGKLRKPPVGVWAVDQLAVDDPTLIAELLAAGADARDAQQNVAAGSESREDLLAATARLRDRVDAAARASAQVLERAGHGATDETARRIRATLLAAATGGVTDRNALWTGTLDRDVDAAGFGGVDEPEEDPAELATLLAPLRRRSPPPSGPAERRRPPASLLLLARRGAERDAADLDAVAERLRASADAKRRQADHLAEEAAFGAQEATAAEQAAEAAEKAAGDAHLALDS